MRVMNVLKKIEEAKRKGYTKLDLSYNQLTELPEEIMQLTNLTELDLSRNLFTTFPKAIVQLTNLTSLDLSANKLTELPNEIAQLTSLTELYLMDNQFCRLPTAINQLTNLTKLYLSRNQFSEVPKEILQLTNLTELYLRANQIAVLPKEIMQLTKLRTLVLSGNQLIELPKESMQLANLVVLDLRWNQLTELSKEILRLTKLHTIHLDGNPLVNPPLEIAKQGIKEIRNYFKALKRGANKLHEAKLIIVGQGGVGKTCLCRKLVDNKYKLRTYEATTEGIEIKEWLWKWRQKNKIVDFKVNIWDFGGQEIYHATHQFFLTKRSLYLFVWEARKEEDYASFDYWLSIVSLLSDKSPVIIVLNKADERVKELDQASLMEKFPNIIGFHKVSCLDGRGIEELTRQIKEEIVKLPHVGIDWPIIWTVIRKKLESDKRDYIDNSEFIQICKNKGLNEEQAGYLSSYLHDLGVILHFHEDEVLRNTVILKPEWGTNAVYRVLDTKSIKENKGKFKFNELSDIWKDKYSPNKYMELLQLMMKFELCFKLADSQEYIVPELLPAERPKYEWVNTNNLRFEYHYEFMPSGIITRFIVRNHRLIEGNIYWKNGAILTRENTRALVISEPLNRKIKISIYGNYGSELLAIIRNEFEHINRTLNNPRVKEKIPCICKQCMQGEAFLFDYEVVRRQNSKGIPDTRCNESDENVSIKALLDGIISPQTQQTAEHIRDTEVAFDSIDELAATSYQIHEENRPKLRVFISYSHQDKKYLGGKSLIGFLRGLEQNDFEFWSDEKIATGQLWDEKIKSQITESDIALVLVSQAFLDSSYCQNVEIKSFLEESKKRGLVIFPAILSACDWEKHPWLCETQFLPGEGKNIESHYKDTGKRKALFLEVRKNLESIGNEIRKKRSCDLYRI